MKPILKIINAPPVSANSRRRKSEVNAMRLRNFLFGLCYVPAILFGTIIVAFIVKTWLVLNNDKIGFEMATIAALLGGFILTGAFLDNQVPARQIRLRRIGITYLVSTISFVVLGFAAPILNDFSFVPYLSAISIAFGALCFAFGTVLLIIEIPRLWLN